MKNLLSLFILFLLVGCSSSNGGSSNIGVSSSQSSALSTLYNLKGESSLGGLSSLSTQSTGATSSDCYYYTFDTVDSTSEPQEELINCSQYIDVSGLNNSSIENFTSTGLLGVEVSSTKKKGAIYIESGIESGFTKVLLIKDAKLDPKDKFTDNGIAFYFQFNTYTGSFYYSIQTWTESSSISSNISKDTLAQPSLSGNVSYISVGSKDDLCITEFTSSKTCKIFVGAFNTDSGKTDLYTAEVSSIQLGTESEVEVELRNSYGEHIGYIIIKLNGINSIFSVVNLERKQFE